ncbi:MAG: adenylate/guanylate cyclase domain-containing protein, partial [Desulfobulbaceae bacterium]|nr:adenylate/guanylate cyclase domain-containing protein [Desulfobulbaceae bacterium]
RELDALRVVGKSEVVVVYELLAVKGGLDQHQQEMLALYNEGLKLYRKRDWRAAVDIFERILNDNPEDGPALTYMERCLDYQVRPPGKNWDGVYVLKIK